MFYWVILCATCFLVGNEQAASKAFLGGFVVVESYNYLCFFGFKEILPSAHNFTLAT